MVPIKGKVNSKIVSDINLNAYDIMEEIYFNNCEDEEHDKQVSKADLMYGCAEVAQTIPIYNYSVDLMDKPFTWSQFMTLNEKMEPEVAITQSVITPTKVAFLDTVR